MSRPVSFSDRDLEYLRRYASRQTIREIAAHLGKHPKTVRAIARRLGLVAPPEIRNTPQVRIANTDAEREERIQRAYENLRARCKAAGLPMRFGHTTDQKLAAAKEAAEAYRRELDWRPESRYAAADLGHEEWFTPRRPRSPTRTRPGTAARIAVYVRRMESGEDFFEDGDLTLWDPVDDLSSDSP